MKAIEWRDAPDAEFAVLGDPIAHSLSPTLHRAAYDALGLPWRFVALRVPLEDARDALDHLAARGYRGASVTLPLKAEALAWAERIDPYAERIGAANTLDFQTRSASNTDAPGFLETLAPLNLDRSRPVLLLGAGGSARAIAVALTDAGFTLRVWNRTPERGVQMMAEVKGRGECVGLPDPTGCQLIVNATASGLAGNVPPVPWMDAAPDTTAYDLVYGPASAPFLDSARGHGLRTMDGLGMLVAQGALAFEQWLRIPAPRDVMLKAVS